MPILAGQRPRWDRPSRTRNPVCEAWLTVLRALNDRILAQSLGASPNGPRHRSKGCRGEFEGGIETKVHQGRYCRRCGGLLGELSFSRFDGAWSDSGLRRAVDHLVRQRPAAADGRDEARETGVDTAIQIGPYGHQT